MILSNGLISSLCAFLCVISPLWSDCVCVCRRGSSRQSLPSRSGCRCSRPLSRHRWQQHLPAPRSRLVPLRTKMRRTTCDPQDGVQTCPKIPSRDSVGTQISQYCHRQRHETRVTAGYYISKNMGKMHIGMDSEEKAEKEDFSR